MESQPIAARSFRFGVFELDTVSGELRKHGVKVRLSDQPFQILRLLLERSGDVVTRQELRDRLWTSDTFVDFDTGLNSAIRKLREALDDSADNPRFIETLPRRGYRFIAPVQPAAPSPQTAAVVHPAAQEAAQIPGVAEPVTTNGAQPTGRIARSLLFAVLATCTLGLAYLAWSWTRPPSPGSRAYIESLAVLPFEDATGDPARAYIATAFSVGLTSDLDQIGDLHVSSRSSTSRFRPPNTKPLPEIARELHVDAIVEGGVTASGQRLLVTARLFRAATEEKLWADSYDVDINNFVDVQRKIARALASAIRKPMVGRRVPYSAIRFVMPRAGVPTNVSPEAYDLSLRALQAVSGQSYDGIKTAAAYLEQAIVIQPDFAAAHAFLAQVRLQLLFTGPLPPREVVPRAEEAARAAIRYDPNLPEAHATLGHILHAYHWKWEEGDKEYRRAGELGGSDEEGEAWRLEMVRDGRVGDAVTTSERAMNLDPLSFNAWVGVGVAYRSAARYQDAVEALKHAIDIDKTMARGHYQLGISYIAMGRVADAIPELEIAVNRARGVNTRFQHYLGYAYAIAGRADRARGILSDLETRRTQQYVSSFGIALIHDALGDKEAALAALEQACDDRATEFAQMPWYPPFRTIADDPRYLDVMRRVGRPNPVTLPVVATSLPSRPNPSR